MTRNLHNKTIHAYAIYLFVCVRFGIFVFRFSFVCFHCTVTKLWNEERQHLMWWWIFVQVTHTRNFDTFRAFLFDSRIFSWNCWFSIWKFQFSRWNFQFSKEILNFPIFQIPGEILNFPKKYLIFPVENLSISRKNFQSSNFSVAASNVQISVKNVYCKISKEILTFAPRTFFKPLKNHQFFNFPLDLM